MKETKKESKKQLLKKRKRKRNEEKKWVWQRTADGGSGDDLVLQAERGLVDEARHKAHLDVLDRGVLAKKEKWNEIF